MQRLLVAFSNAALGFYFDPEEKAMRRLSSPECFARRK